MGTALKMNVPGRERERERRKGYSRSKRADSRTVHFEYNQPYFWDTRTGKLDCYFLFFFFF